MDQPYQRQDPLDLAALDVADEVPGEAIAPALLLLLEVLLAILTDELDTGLRQDPHVLGPYVLRRGEDLHPGSCSLADSRQIGADPVDVEVRDGLDHRQSIQTRPAWRPVRVPSRRCE